MKKYVSLFFVVVVLLVGTKLYLNQVAQSKKQENLEDSTPPEPVLKFGYDVSTTTFEDYKIKRNAFMADILMDHDIDYDDILKLERKAEEVFSLRKIKAGKNITFIKNDPCERPIGFVYKPGRLTFVKYELDKEIAVSKHEIPHEFCIETASGIVQSSLWNAMMDQGFDVGLIDKMEDAISQVNFHFAQPHDQFKLVYERIYVEGEPVGTGQIFSAAYQSSGIINYGFYFENDKYKGYYDLEGTPNKRTFLNAPVRFSRVSSVFNRNRFHPVLKRRKPHLGTDYAAPRGTPIFAVADGVVTHRSYTKGNGNYVKIKHDRTYQTQYLHMSKFAKNVKRGSRVSQGQTIGYVGSTGLATGPHVCFRFWKNGRQINHRRENFPPLNPMAESELPTFYQHRDKLLIELDDVPFLKPDDNIGTASD